ncbi:MAG: peptidoglycan DD-metalloendopeptidase family protein [Gammaproteobacteria bacterium]|nr:peptidoglycan DD-metalloendopeptidase family protein [Gammaproteobacteria bacterium]
MITVGFSLSLVLANANDHRLIQLNRKIKTIKAGLRQDRSTRSNLQQALEKVELASARIMRRLNKTQQRLSAQHQRLAKLKQLEQQDRTKIQHQQDLLLQQLRQAYMLGRQPYLKLLLNQQDPNQLSRMLTYYHYINRSRLTAINGLEAILEQAENNQRHYQAEYVVLTRLSKKQSDEQSKLLKVRNHRHQLVHQINHKIKTKRLRLAQLISNKRRLEYTLTQLERSHYAEQFSGKRFSQQKGKLAWPVRGKILNYFGTQIGQSGLRWSGVLIRAHDGQPIYAIARGKVVFAKWLAGYGLLLIVNHGKGYMTLYGRNHYLYKKVGDRIQAGDLIAAVGQSGGYQTSALYFSIRHNAKPLNPSQWCTQKTKL